MSNWFNKNLEDAVVILRMPHEVRDGMNIYSGKDLAELVNHLIKVDDEFGELLAEVKRLRDAITEADKTAGDILDGVIAPSRIGGLRNKLRDAIRR